MRFSVASLLATVATGCLLAGIADAQTAPDNGTEAAKPSPPSAPAPAAAPPSWASGVKFTAHVEVGGTFNPAGPDSTVNFGHLFTDKANEGLLNQAALTLERDIDPKATGLDIGFKLQGFYGSDARYTHFVGEIDREVSGINQFDVVEANFTVHAPLLFKGGIDFKGGQFSTPIGEEVIDPTGNFFYSHSYIFNFGIPLKHTGFYFTSHVSPILDIYTGYDTGVNTSVGSKGGYNNDQFHFLGGFGLNFSKLTVLALTQIGPELPQFALGPNVESHNYNRYLNDVVLTYKFNDKLTSITELNYIRDDGAKATGGGVAQYLTYVVTPEISLGARAEVWRDNNGFYVAGFPHHFDYLNASYFTGVPGVAAFGFGPETYGAITVGMNFKPQKLPKMIDGLVLRPELRYDRSLKGLRPFGDPTEKNRGQFTFGIDGVLPITF